MGVALRAATAVVVAVALAAPASAGRLVASAPPAQDPPATPAAKSQVEIVSTVGCVERRATTLWLTRASAPAASRRGVFNQPEVEEARGLEPGTGEFRLIGEAEFLGAEGLLRTAERAAFTTPEQVNATGGLREGRTVLVKGLLIEADDEARINLLAVVPLAESCRE